MTIFMTYLMFVISVINYTNGIKLVNNINFSMIREINDNSPVDVFHTVTISSLEECAKLCYSITSCRIGNYRFKGHSCQLTHTLWAGSFTIQTQKASGCVSWTRDMLDQLPILKSTRQCSNLLNSELECFSTNDYSNQALRMLSPVFTDDNTPCLTCPGSKSCIVNYNQSTCDTFACYNPGSTVKGNMFTINDKIHARTCYNHTYDVTPEVTITCTDDGQWAWPDCGYINHTLLDGTEFLYKMIEVHVNQSTALRNCRKDGANLTTIFTLEKLNFYRSLASSNEDYWADARRVQGSEWRTSDGRLQPMGYDIWEEYDVMDANDNCVRMRRQKQHKLDDWWCHVDYSYICEKEL